MSPIRSILIVLDVYNDFRDDPTHQPLEIRKALALADYPSETTLYLIGCGFEEFLHDTYSNFSADAPAQRREFTNRMANRLEVFAKVLRLEGYTVECRVHWTFPRYEQIAKEAEALNVDLVVQHVNAQKPHERHNLSHDTWQLVKNCRKPLLLIKDSEWPAEPVVIASVDPVHSHHKPKGLDHAILSTAIDTSDALHGRVQVVHAYTESGLSLSVTGAVREVHAKAMGTLLADFDIADHAVHLLDDTPVNAILKCREALHADIIVIGALSRSRLAEVIIGNTAERVLDYVQSDLYIIRPD